MNTIGDEAAHILVIDDDRRIRELLRSYLSRQGFRVTTAAGAAPAYRLMAGLVFDLIVVDVMMPGENGLDFTRNLRQRSKIPILILSALGETKDRIEGFETGGDDYLPKPFEPRELALRLRSILSRKEPTQPPQMAEIAFGDRVFDTGRKLLRHDGKTIKLTTRERDVLSILAARRGEVVGREALGHHGPGDKLRAVDVQINRLRQKLEPDPKTPVYLQTVHGRGYILYSD